MATFNNFLQGVATQVTNTALKRVAGNLPGINNSYPYINNSSRGGESSDQLPLAPRGNFQHYTFPLDVMAEPGLGNQGHYMMFYINQQENVKIQYGGKSGSGTSITGTSERSTPSHLRKLNSKGSYVKVKNENGVRDQINLDIDPIFFDPFAEDRFKARGAGSLYARNYAAAVDRQAIAVKRRATKRMTSAIVMYMPAQVSTSYKTEYTDTEIGAITNAAMNAYDAVVAGKLRQAVDEVGGMVPAEAEQIQKLMLSTAGALPGLAGVKAAVEMRKGVVLSDRMELAFKGLEKRGFEYSFKMVPKSQEEANEIRNIIFAFKSNMLPEFLGTNLGGRSLRVPNTFDIEYMWNGGENQFLHRISTCVLESMDVTYGGDRYKSYAGIDGDGAPPIETTISLTFKEIELITRERVHEGF